MTVTATAFRAAARDRDAPVGATSGDHAAVLLEGVLVADRVVGVPLTSCSTIPIEAVPFREVIRADYPPFVPVLGLLAMLAITVLATLYPARQAARMTVAEILRYQ